MAERRLSARRVRSLCAAARARLRDRGAAGRRIALGLVYAALVVLAHAAPPTVPPVWAVEDPVPAVAPPPGGVRRIVSLAPSITETIFALGAGDRLVGVSSYCDFPIAATRLPRVGSYLAPEMETIVALRPDAVLAVPTPGNRAAVERLRSLGVPVVVVGERSLADARETMRTVAAWTGQPEPGEALIARVDAELDEVRRVVAALPRRRTLLVVGHDPLVVAGRGMFVDELLEIAGGVNAATAAGAAGRWPQLSMEAVLAAAPEVIVDGAMGSEAGASAAAYWQPYSSLPAVRHGRVVALRSAEVLRPGPRLGAAARQLADAVHGGRSADGTTIGMPWPTASTPAPAEPAAASRRSEAQP